MCDADLSKQTDLIAVLLRLLPHNCWGWCCCKEGMDLHTTLEQVSAHGHPPPPAASKHL